MASRQHDGENPSPANSPNSTGSIIGYPRDIITSPITAKPVSMSEPNPYPSAIVQADTTTFKQVVQMLTGSASSKPTQQPAPSPAKIPTPPVKTSQGFKLYERRNSLEKVLMINPSEVKFRHRRGISPRSGETLFDFPSLVVSPVTPLMEETFCKSSPSEGFTSEEEMAIAEKGSYLHPSPPEPRLLPLFPVASPGVSRSPS